MTSAPRPSLAELVAAIAGGDAGSLDALYARTSDPIYGMAVRIVRDAQVAEDVCLEVYAQVWRSAGSYRPERGSVLAWLVTLVRSRAIDRVRQDQARPQAGGADALEGVTDEREGPAAMAATGDAAEQLREALVSLSGDQRTAIEAAFFGGMTHAEIARSQGIPLGTVKRRIRDGLERLRESLSRNRGAAR